MTAEFTNWTDGPFNEDVGTDEYADMPSVNINQFDNT